MRLFLFLLAVWVFTFPAQPARAQTADTGRINRSASPNSQSTDDRIANSETEYITPQMGLFALLTVLTLAAITGISLVFTALILLGLLIIAGATSGGLLIGLYKRSFQDGFRTFFALAFAGLGTLLGGGIFWAIPTIQHWFFPNKALMPLGGACIGFVGGYGMGILIFLLFRKVLRFLLKRMTTKTGQKTSGFDGQR